jgi:hypothetical protein
MTVVPPSNNDKAAINAALSAAGQAGGGIVDLDGSQSYTITGGSSGIVIGGNNVWLRGNGAKIRLSSSCSEDIVKIFSGGPLQNSGVSDFTIDANNFAVAGRGAVNLNSVVSGGFVRRVKVINQGVTGISVQGCNDFEVTDCYCKLNTPLNSQNHGILVTENIQQNNGLIARNHCVNTNMEIDGTYITVAENHIQGWKYGSGITMGPSQRTHSNVIADNICTDGVGVDVDITYVAGYELWTPRSSVTGNYAYNNSGNGIMIGGERMSVIGNVCLNNGQTRHAGDANGIYAQWNGQQGGTNCVIAGNVAGNIGNNTTQQYGYSENGSIRGNVIGVNNFNNNASNPMQLNSGTVVAVTRTT